MSTTKEKTTEDGLWMEKNSRKAFHRICSENRFANILTKLEKFWLNEKFCDVILISGVDGKRIHANRMILSANSEFFATMFSSPMRESKEKVVKIEELPGETLQTLIAYCYSGLIDLNKMNVTQVLCGAHFIQLRAVVSLCEHFLVKLLDLSNCIEFQYLGDKYNCVNLSYEANNFIQYHFVEIFQRQEYFDLTFDQLELLLKSDNLNVYSEEKAFECLSSWVQYDLANRKKYIPELLPLIRLPLLSPNFIADHVENFHDSLECKDLVIEAMCWHLSPERTLAVQNRRNIPRRATVTNLLTIVYLNNGIINIQSYCDMLKIWKEWEIPEKKVTYFKVTKYADRLIFVGNTIVDSRIVEVFSLDLNLKTWTHHCFMRERTNFCIALLDEFIYVIGGLIGNQFSGCVERYDIKNENFKEITKMNAAKSKPGVAALNGNLYVVGGCHANPPDPNVIVQYSPSEDKWTTKAHCVRVALVRCVTVFDGKLYALGVQGEKVNCMQCYDPLKNVWTAVCQTMTNVLDCGFVKDRLIAIDGLGNAMSAKAILEYKQETNSWNETVLFPAQNIKLAYIVPI